MDADRNLLFGVVALQADLLDADQFIKACTLWTARKDVPLADLLVELGWLTAEDKSDVERLLTRKMKKHAGNIKNSLAAAPDNIKRSLAALGDADIQQSLVSLPEGQNLQLETIDHRPEPTERYTLTRLHATGGIGRVWLASDNELGREVALKELRPERADDARLWARFLQEARVTGQLEHPGIVPVYELARRPGDRQPYYTMRFVRGRTLSEAACDYHQKRRAGQAGTFEILDLLSAFVTVCNTVAYAHSRGIIHRDLKGQNVIMGDFGDVVVLDWGLAKVIGGQEPRTKSQEPNLKEELEIGSWNLGFPGSGSDLTVQGQVVGTPGYMAPEQAAGHSAQLDARTDVYGLGAMLYEILTGQAPFVGSDTEEVLRKVREEEPAPPRQAWPDVPAALETICLRALSKKPADRYASATEPAHEVQVWQEIQRRDSEALYHSLVETLPLSIFRKDLEGRFIFGNRRFFEMMGKAPEQILGKTDFDFVTPALAEKYRRDDRRVVETGEVFEDVEQYEIHGAEPRYVQIIKSAVHDAQGRVIGTQGIFWDVTERKKAEVALRESEERYRSVIAAMQDGIALLNADGTIYACNTAAERILGLSADQIRGRTTYDPRWRAIHEDGSPFPGETHPPMVTLRTGKPCYEVVMGIHKPDGTLTWISINSQPLVRPKETTPYAVVASFEDITDRKRTTRPFWLRPKTGARPEGS
jgi:PAS domain S-box-containing protein